MGENEVFPRHFEGRPRVLRYLRSYVSSGILPLCNGRWVWVSGLFCCPSGVWKILGAISILLPRFPLLKEWAYAGTFFDLRVIV